MPTTSFGLFMEFLTGLLTCENTELDTNNSNNKNRIKNYFVNIINGLKVNI